jgi:hypothetical protein
MRELNLEKLPTYVELSVVSDGSTVRVKRCADSVPARLIGARVRVRSFGVRCAMPLWRSSSLYQAKNSRQKSTASPTPTNSSGNDAWYFGAFN